MHDEVADDPKVQQLPDKLFKTWINLLCVASRNGGKLPERMEDVAFALRLRISDTQARVDALIAAGLLERDGIALTPHNWNGRQYKSDISTERVKQFRERQGNVSRNAPEQSRTEQSRAEGDAKSLPPLALAQKVAAELQLRGPGIIPAIGGAIEALVAEGKGHNAAVEFLIAHGKDAHGRGETVNRFWFDDSKWRKKVAENGNETRQIAQAGKCAVHPESGSDHMGRCWGCVNETPEQTLERIRGNAARAAKASGR